MSGEFPRGILELFEDFLTDNVTNWNENTAGSGSIDITNKHGGWMRLTTSTGDTDCASISGECAWEVDEGHPLIMEVRLKTDDVSVASVGVGMTDAVDDCVIIEDEDGTLGATATDAFAFLMEGEQDETWQAVSVDTDVVTTQVALTDAADAADGIIQTLRLEANPNDSGTVKYFVDGELVSTRTSWFDSSIVLCPMVSVDGRTSAFNTDIDYIYVMAPRS